MDVGPACHSSSSSSLCPEPSGARALAPSLPPSVDLPPPATILRFLAQEPSPAPPPPSQTPSPASPRTESPNHRRSPLEVLEALLHRRSASPVVFHPTKPSKWVHGELLVLPGLFLSGFRRRTAGTPCAMVWLAMTGLTALVSRSDR